MTGSANGFPPPKAQIPAENAEDRVPASFQPSGDAELDRLRELLFSREIALLDKLVARMEEKRYNTQKVCEVVAEAIALRAKKDGQLSIALEPLVDGILKGSLHRRKNDFVNALFPLMGPSIRKSIAETFRSMLESFSKSVEMAFSWRGLRWRLEAWRSGKSFSEIVLLRTLVYRVEQMFFIHSETGLVLAHAENEGVGAQDADMVSAMLTAIQDFVRDCFASGSEGDLESLQMGEFTILIEKSPQAYLACVVRGTPPASFPALLRETLEMMLIEYDEDLSRFSGDAAPFVTALRHLQACMVSRYVGDERKLPLWAKVFPALIIISLVGWFGYNHYAQTERNALLERGLALMSAEPGLMLTEITRHKSAPWAVTAFKDELAPSPDELLRGHGLDPANFTIRAVPFISYDMAIVSRRVRDDITLPAEVTMRLEKNGSLFFEGRAAMSWILRARDSVRRIPGVREVDFSGVRDPMVEELAALVKFVESVSIEFPLGKDTPIPADTPKLKKAVDTLVEIEKIARHMGLVLSLTVYGHADTTGAEKRNYEISQERAKTVAAMLYARGSSIPIALYGMGSEYPKGGSSEDREDHKKKEDQSSRRIELRVHLAQAATADTQILGY